MGNEDQRARRETDEERLDPALLLLLLLLALVPQRLTRNAPRDLKAQY